MGPPHPPSSKHTLPLTPHTIGDSLMHALDGATVTHRATQYFTLAYACSCLHEACKVYPTKIFKIQNLLLITIGSASRHERRGHGADVSVCVAARRGRARRCAADDVVCGSQTAQRPRMGTKLGEKQLGVVRGVSADGGDSRADVSTRMAQCRACVSDCDCGITRSLHACMHAKFVYACGWKHNCRCNTAQHTPQVCVARRRVHCSSRVQPGCGSLKMSLNTSYTHRTYPL